MAEPSKRRRGPSPNQARSKARAMAAQAQYQRELYGAGLTHVITHFREEPTDRAANFDYFTELLTGIDANRNRLIDVIKPLLDRAWEQVDPTERGILLLAGFELAEKLETPYRVVINEGVNLAKTFGAEASHKYINGVLDKLARQFREAEVAAGR